ncbi:uncharacterized protein LOC108481536 [Gossypium arboreum]|uniref:uncharacterized protein LOC108481536 n=1 Tax=Gossypium arboreum TaxID=29729 RepID=UPI0008193CB6|nr:uncharacterized protein LOC108481536 [Gossypium arboreum]
MELVDDEDVETTIALYYGNGSDKNSPIHLFVELADMEQNEDLTAYGEEHAIEEPCVVAPILYVDSESTIRGIDINLNVTPDIDVVSDDGYDNSDPCDEEVDSDSDPDVDDVPDDIDNEDVNDDGNINASSVGNQMRRVVIHNNLGPHMSLIDPNVAHEAEFPEYPEILPAHWLAVNSQHEELLVGQRFESKEECVFAIKRYSMNISMDYKVAVSKPILYIGECWKSAEGCNWRVRAAFIQKSQMWEIRKFVGPHTCTSICMTEDHGKLDSKTICTFIMPMVKDMPTIKFSVLIAEMQVRFQYQVSYRKAWIAKQMAMEQFYGDFDASYNELQGWIATMREYVLRTIIELQTRPYYGPDDQLQPGKRIFHLMFWMFDPCVRVFPHCKPFVQVDGTWLYGKYTQILLLTVAQDDNRNVLPIAFVIVNKENMESWEFFLTNLQRDVISNDNICIISDRGKGLSVAIRHSGVPWRSIYLYELEPHIFCQRMARLESDMEGQTNTSFQQWLGTIEPWQWAQSFDEGFRYSQITTNLVEGVNAVLLKTRHLPILSVFLATFYRLATLMPRMGQQQVNKIEAAHVFVEDVRDAMVANSRMARSMNIEIYSRCHETFRVTETIGRRLVYHLGPMELTSVTDGVIAGACAKVNLNVEQFVDDVYTLERMLRIWENEFPVLPDLST